MASYSYEAVDKSGKTKKGSIEAENQAKAVALIKADGSIPISVTEQNMMTKDINLNIQSKPKARDYSVFCRQFNRRPSYVV